MLKLALLRRSMAALGIGAMGVSPALPMIAGALFGATIPVSEVSASPTPFSPDLPDISPDDVIDGNDGLPGGFPPFPPLPPPPYVPPEDIEDGTGGIDGHLP